MSPSTAGVRPASAPDAGATVADARDLAHRPLATSKAAIVRALDVEPSARASRPAINQVGVAARPDLRLCPRPFHSVASHLPTLKFRQGLMRAALPDNLKAEPAARNSNVSESVTFKSRIARPARELSK